MLSSKPRINPARAFARAKIYAAVILISMPLVLAGLILIDPRPSSESRTQDFLSALVGQDAAVWTLLLSTGALIAAAFGAAFTIMVGWRRDRRRVTELTREIDQMAERQASA